MLARFDLSDLSRRPSAIFALILLTSVVVIMLVPFTARTWRNKPSTALPQYSGAAQQTRPTTEPLGQLLITIRPTGFDPQEIVQTNGEFLLSVDNRSGLEAVDLQLEAEQGNRLHAKRVPREQLDWREVVYLNPGTYLLKETNRPDWVCRIHITSK
jgi:hypothetical protein